MRTVAAATLALFAGPAFAHPGHAVAPGTLAELSHLLTAPDHVLLLVGAPLLLLAGAAVLALRAHAGGDDV
jgi:hypothetical protein